MAKKPHQFDNPVQFVVWLSTLPKNVQTEIARLILALNDLGIPASVAAHTIYDVVVAKMPGYAADAPDNDATLH